MTQQVIPHPDAGSRKGKALETVAGITYADNFASITGYRIKCGMTRQVTPHPDAGSRKGKALETVAGIIYADNFACIPGFRIKRGMTRQVTPHPDAGSRKGKALETVAGITYADNFACIPGFRIKCGMTHSPHQVRNDRSTRRSAEWTRHKKGRQSNTPCRPIVSNRFLFTSPKPSATDCLRIRYRGLHPATIP